MEGSRKSGNNPEAHSSSGGLAPPDPIIALVEQQIEPLEGNPISQWVYQVFNEELLREIIINYAIHNNNEQLSSSIIKSCRLVQKSWLVTVSKLLRKQRSPLLYLHLDKDNSLQESAFVQQNGKLLNQFLKKASNKTSPSFVDDRIPPFAIKATQDFFEKENYISFRDILLKCGNALVEMDLEIPPNGGSMPFVFPPQLSLPMLTDFTFKFTDKSGDDDDEDDTDTGNNDTSIYLLQLILNASHESLKQLILPFTLEDAIPTGLEYLTLPVAITELNLFCQMNSENLKILLNNSLPNLKNLELIIPFKRFDDGLISQILEKFCKTLEYVCFSGVASVFHDFHDGTPRFPTNFKLPFIIKNMKQIRITSTHLELENNLRSLESCLPELTSLNLEYQTVPMIRKWMDDSKFEKVLDLHMSLVDANFHDEHEHYFVNLDAEIMQSLHLAFPNLKTLEITVCGADMSGLEYLFLEMKQLEDLEINVRRTEDLVNSDVWDSLLTGVTVEIATALRTTPAFSEFFKLKNESRPSIRNLKYLRRFKITTPDSPPRLAKVPLISDSAFHFGFFKLPKLAKLLLGGRFLASNEISGKWNALRGQEIIYEDEDVED